MEAVYSFMSFLKQYLSICHLKKPAAAKAAALQDSSNGSTGFRIIRVKQKTLYVSTQGFALNHEKPFYLPANKFTVS